MLVFVGLLRIWARVCFFVITMQLEGASPHAFSPGISMNHWCPHPDPVSTRSRFVPRNLTTSRHSQIFLDGAFGVQIVQFHTHTSIRSNKSHPYAAALTHLVLGGCLLLLLQPTFLSFQPWLQMPSEVILSDCITIHLQRSSLTVSTPIINVVACYPTAVQSQKKQILNRCSIFFLKAT